MVGGVGHTIVEAVATLLMMVCIVAAAATVGWWIMDIVFEWLRTFVW